MATPWASSSRTASTTSRTDRSCPRWTTSAPWACRIRRMMLIAASCPSNRAAAVTNRTGCAGTYRSRGWAGPDMTDLKYLDGQYLEVKVIGASRQGVRWVRARPRPVRPHCRGASPVERPVARARRPHGRGHLGHAGPAAAAGPDRGHPAAVRPDLRRVRGAPAARLHPERVDADGQDGRAADGPPGLGDQRDPPAGAPRAGRTAYLGGGPARGAGHHPRRGPGGGPRRHRGAEPGGLRHRGAVPGRDGSAHLDAAAGPGGGGGHHGRAGADWIDWVLNWIYRGLNWVGRGLEKKN